MKQNIIGTTLLASMLALWAMPARAQTPAERPSDKAVKALIDQVDEGRDKFEGNLDGTFKGSTLRGPRGETKVAGALQDYQDSTQKLKDRFSPEYAANPEASTVLTQSMAIDTFMEGQPSTMKGRAEWTRQRANLERLAEAYGTTFPLPDGATPRRISDKETLAAANAISTPGNRLKSDIDKNKTLSKPERDAAKKDVELLVKQAETVKSRINDGEPAMADVRQLVEQANSVGTFISAHPMPNMTNWQSIRASLAKLQQSFGLTPSN